MIQLTLSGGAKVYVDMQIDKSHCRGCRKQIFWASTMNGKKMPICQDEKGEWISHFVDCPKSQFFRKGKYVIDNDYSLQTNGIETINERRIVTATIIPTKPYKYD